MKAESDDNSSQKFDLLACFSATFQRVSYYTLDTDASKCTT